MTEEPAPRTARVAVWDLPIRLFHWVLVALIAFSWWSGKNEELELHMYSGYAILTLLIFRLLWGFFGSSTARFANFLRGPRSALAYLRDMRGWRPIGHNPIGALSVVIMLLLLMAQVALGLVQIEDDGLVEGPLAHLVSLETAEWAHDMHHDLFDVLLVVMGLHIAAILLYRVTLGLRLTWPMFTGQAELDPATEPMRPVSGWVAVACLLVALGITRWIIAGAPPFGT